MADDKTYPMVEIVGVSDESIQQAVKNALARASETIRNIDWFEVTEMRGVVDNGKPIFQVTVKLGFRYE
jgi:flavin-binding protein dodecin